MTTVFGKRKKATIGMFSLLSIACICTVLVMGCPQQKLTRQEAMSGDGKQIVVELLMPKDAFEYIKKNKDNSNFVILDIRTPEEFADGHIDGAININFRADNFTSEMNKLDKNKTYFVYCRTGNRSYEAVNIMAGLNFRSILRLSDDILGWKAAGLPLVK
jgi:rhodanese-related sulfurtransferase